MKVYKPRTSQSPDLMIDDHLLIKDSRSSNADPIDDFSQMSPVNQSALAVKEVHLNDSMDSQNEVLY